MYELVATWVGKNKFNKYTIETYLLRKDVPKTDFHTTSVYVATPFCNCQGYQKAVFYSKIRLRCLRKRLFNFYKDTKKKHTFFTQEIEFVLQDMKIQSVA